MAGQGESQGCLVHPTGLTRVLHGNRVGRGRRGRRSLSLVVSVVGFSHSKEDHGDGEVDGAGDQRGDPFGPTESVVGFILFEVEVDLLEDVLGLEGDHAGFMFEFMDGVLKLGLGDVLQNAFGVPPPVENLGFGTGKNGGLFSIDLVVLESNVASG